MVSNKKIKSIYLIAICGTGMASLAGLLQKSGYLVTGSDANIYPPMSTLLKSSGIDIKSGYQRNNITADIDQVIVGNAVSKDNPEVLAVQEKGIPYISFPEAIKKFYLKNQKSLVVTGTHGKTTTTALLSWVLHSAKRKPGFMVGGWMKNFDGNHAIPEGEFFVSEGDEYDTAFFDKGPKFLHYSPFASILTGIEFDHADIYRDLDHIKNSFRKFVNIIHPSGFLLAAFSDKNVQDVLADASCQVETYGFSSSADWVIGDYKFVSGKGYFTLSHQNVNVANFNLPMIGRHNIQNATSVAVMGLKLGLTTQEIQEGFHTFKGIKRRQEVLGVKNGVTVIDDFAHHPTAIQLTLEGIKEAYPGQRIWAIFEPRSATCKRKVFEDRLPKSFTPADLVIIADLFAPDKIDPKDRLNPELVVENINNDGGDAYFIPDTEALINKLITECRPKDVLLIMSSGGFSGIHQKLIARL
ncbi:MAG: UDP-N-acetylmuramate:L-alanyl-gamma-D-glutamyl-meso-diaminopimelate ligase [Nitrospina sp.]|jgi:UDP-N-acetylmuramate: L-alanyl-gamma-D-glutamyl-meso-diaminopimelate ligase|nr:UDP-N-acetylmuramate:L-alanyl-gamma-D-glutamyl-meso-diaminopimelate ligase [Nitrospina sp.]MBT6663516.1 UDP-N-acetylmuramate:L-alanyl-gamma-D-glutamyl-meso-diaminopimelate ligase [Nitrospina sp.]